MKKLLFVVLLLIFPISVYAKTPNLDETLKVIKDINNVLVDDDVKIEFTTVEDDSIIFIINGNSVKVDYTFSDNKFSFVGGTFQLDNNKKIIGDIQDNQYAFYLYSILESKSTIPYDQDDYYNDNNIKKMINNNFNDVYKEKTNTFGISLKEITKNKYQLVYDYYLDGDYPVIELDTLSNDIKNPATGNYNILITIMLVSVLCIGLYTYFEPNKSK